MDEAAGFVNPFELLMMRQSARRDVLEAMFQSVVRQLVMTNDGDPVGVQASIPLTREDVDRLEVVDTELIAGERPSVSLFVCLSVCVSRCLVIICFSPSVSFPVCLSLSICF